jgi:hypothetical protein
MFGYRNVDNGNIDRHQEGPMKRAPGTAASLVARAWAIDRPLTAVTVAMLPLLAACLVGLAVDPRLISGAPAWLKPAKFAASIAIFSATMVWVFSYLPAWPRLRRRVSVIASAVFVLEMSIISLQAWRGTTSHFNTATPLDATLFATMGAAILMQTATTVAVAIALWRQTFADRALGWALRLGMAISIAGSLTGGLMAQPTRAQIAEARATGRMPVSGAHTVGAPDGGPGLPGTGWSTQHGDIRVAHFVGLHALQVLPAMLWLTRSRGRARTAVVVAAAASDASLFALLLWQALMGEPVMHPSAPTVAAFVAWAAGSAAALAAAALVSATSRHSGAVAI